MTQTIEIEIPEHAVFLGAAFAFRTTAGLAAQFQMHVEGEHAMRETANALVLAIRSSESRKGIWVPGGVDGA